jgi:hypothetical protein
MRKLLLIALAVLVSVSLATAQSKVETKWHCSKATAEHKLDVGDAPDHSYSIQQGTCEATASSGDLKEKSGQYTEFRDAWKASFNFHGHYNATTESGDKVYYTYEGSASTDIAKPAANKWKIASGTGKNKGAKGSGTCAGKANADGSADWECTGTVTMAMGKMDKMEKMSK